MPLFGPRPLPLTSYGYQPPRGATARGWRCANDDCGTGEREPVSRWPFRCRRCGWPADPDFDEPWAHDALGVELTTEIRSHTGARAIVAQDRLLNWQLKDALLRSDAATAATARNAIRRLAEGRLREDRSWNPVFLVGPAVWDALTAGDLEGAAEDLCFWLEISTGEDAAESNSARHNARTVIDTGAKFLAAPGGAAHPRAAEIRSGCLRVAEGAFAVLNPEQQAAVMRMARA